QPPVARPHFHRIPYTTLFRSLWRQARLLVTRTTPAESSISLAPSSARNSQMMLWSPSLGTPWRNGQHCPELSSPRSEPRSFLSTMSVPSISSLRCSGSRAPPRSEEHTSELQSRFDLVCRLL